jgi:riboflavin kinase
MVMSLGYNPYYGNKVRSVEVHVMHTFERDFYDAYLNLSILGFIRPEYDYVSKEALIDDIKTDIEVAGRSLDREGYKALREDKWLWTFPEK